jgi:hypothetical protein
MDTPQTADSSIFKAPADVHRFSLAHNGRNQTKIYPGGADCKPLSKSSLLLMSAQSARELSLAHHLALVACRGDSGNRHQITELVCSVYMAYFL